MKISCSICAEDFPVRRYSSQMQKLPCCNMTLCRTCLYSHIRSILEEGITGDGRKELKCPFGCGAEISDDVVRMIFNAHHWNMVRKVIGRFFYCLYLVLSNHMYSNGNGNGNGNTLKDKNLELCTRLTKSSAERQDLQLYEKWSLTVALSSIMHGNAAAAAGDGGTDGDTDGHGDERDGNGDRDGDEDGDANQIYTHVIRCPRPDCECLWLSNTVYRKRKLAQERTYNKKRRPEEAPKGLTKSLILSASGWLFFKPLKPEMEEEIMDENGYTTLHWLNATDIDVFRKANANTNTNTNINTNMSGMRRLTNQHAAERDGRRVTCPGCEFHFCALCSRPWSTLSRYSGARIDHSGKLCSIYTQKILSKQDDDYVDMADAGDARCCPGCSIRTNRTEGCNHISCPCGYEWCYVCGCRWNSRHYQCVDGDVNRQVGATSTCVIC